MSIDLTNAIFLDRGFQVGIGVTLGPELWDDTLAGTISNSGGSAGSYSFPALSNTTVGTSGSYPRFRFDLGLDTSKTYQLLVETAGDTGSLVSAGGGSSGSRIDAVDGAVSGSFMPFNSEFYIIGDGRSPFMITLSSVSVREVL
jgi:hypothetical protein